MACGLALLLCGDRIPLPATPGRLRRRSRSPCRSRAPRGGSSPTRAASPARWLCPSSSIVGVGTSLWILALGNSVDAPLAAFLVLAPLITMVTTVPISIGGWGVREGATVAALGLLGVAPASALAVSVQFGLVMLVVGAAGRRADAARHAAQTGSGEAASRACGIARWGRVVNAARVAQQTVLRLSLDAQQWVRLSIDELLLDVLKSGSLSGKRKQSRSFLKRQPAEFTVFVVEPDQAV